MTDPKLLQILTEIASNLQIGPIQIWTLVFAGVGAIGTTFFTALLWKVTVQMARATHRATDVAEASLKFNKMIQKELQGRELALRNKYRSFTFCPCRQASTPIAINPDGFSQSPLFLTSK